VANGTVAGSAVAFDFGNSSWHNTGTLTANTMSGTSSIQLDDNGTPLPFTASWTASRH
jgi:hypothetical protein